MLLQALRTCCDLLAQQLNIRLYCFGLLLLMMMIILVTVDVWVLMFHVKIVTITVLNQTGLITNDNCSTVPYFRPSSRIFNTLFTLLYLSLRLGKR